MRLRIGRISCHAGLFGALLLMVLWEKSIVDAKKAPISSIDDLEFDENGKLKTFNLVYPFFSDKSCPTPSFEPWYGYQSQALSGDAMTTVFPNYKEGDCVAACLERGTDRSVAGHTMPHLHYYQPSGEATERTFRDWYEANCHGVEICLLNYYNKQKPLQINWVNSRTGLSQKHKQIAYGERHTQCFRSYLGHKFEVYDDKDGKIEEFVVEHVMTRGFGECPPSDNRPQSHEFTAEIETTLHNEWRRHNVAKRTFSPLGFNKGRLPKDVFASMGSFYYNNRFNQVREEWGGRGVFVNWWESNVSFIQIPWDTKGLWQIRLADLVSAWAGVEVEQTVMYGLRQYEDKARLLTHVDRLPTHAVSLIVNVAQGNMTAPWPVEVFDHADRLHEVLMEPGDIVYYESAKNLHSRNRPLQGIDCGGYYVNLFTHYRPKADGDNWYKNMDQPNVPAPVLDVDGECYLKSVGMTDTSSGRLGLVKEVHCDDPRLGKYVSPTLFKANSADDLIQWWRQTGSDYQEPVPPATSAPNANAEDGNTDGNDEL